MQQTSQDIEFDTKSNVYYVRGQSWAVGHSYTLHSILGEGSFSCVCSATSKITQQKVALKRIPDVLSSTENAKRVLRELCILRRLSHPYIISLKHAFVLPSDTGVWKLRNGELVPCSIDLYLAMEYGAGGDLHNLRGQMSEQDVKRLMWQILTAVEYLHSQNVWHRDLKSANILLNVEDGQRVCKIADFGSARSAASHPVHRESGLICSHRRDLSCQSMELPSTCFESIEEQSLTQSVCTPCYRAPEVVMSRGGYTSALDMWSIGCIFAELLQRVYYVGGASTPQLKVSPLFCITGWPKTPSTGDWYEAGPSNAMTRTELEALFAVIGTPAWACIASVQSPEWRQYLRNLPLRAGTLHRRFGHAGEVAVDLLSRMLTFDPSRRCSASEARHHEYFREYWLPTSDPDTDMLNSIAEHDPSVTNGVHYHEIEDPAKALEVLEEEMVEICNSQGGCDALQGLLVKECELLAETESQRLGASISGKYGSITNTLARRCMQDAPSEFYKLLREGLVVDPNCDSNLTPESFGPGRLPHVADFMKADLDLEKHLAIGRQAEWTTSSGCGPNVQNTWGVSLLPPGVDEHTIDLELREVIRSQQLR
eukprot:g2218.t1